MLISVYSHQCSCRLLSTFLTQYLFWFLCFDHVIITLIFPACYTHALIRLKNYLKLPKIRNALLVPWRVWKFSQTSLCKCSEGSIQLVLFWIYQKFVPGSVFISFFSFYKGLKNFIKSVSNLILFSALCPTTAPVTTTRTTDVTFASTTRDSTTITGKTTKRKTTKKRVPPVRNRKKDCRKLWAFTRDSKMMLIVAEQNAVGFYQLGPKL